VLAAAAESIEAFDLPPFAEVFNRGVAAVMLSHIRYPALDPDWPASLSMVVARDLLRGKMNFDGLVLTDDLDMGAIKPAISIETSVARILAADIDLALICHRSSDIETAHELLCKAIENDAGLRRQACACRQRMMQVKSEPLG
jgi:beta-N-acetylhexosaminidase